MAEEDESNLFAHFGDLDMAEDANSKSRRTAALAAPSLTEDGKLRVLTDYVSVVETRTIARAPTEDSQCSGSCRRRTNLHWLVLWPERIS